MEDRRLLAADLIVEDVWTDPSQVVQGEDFRIMARVKNQGNSTASAGLFANQEALFFLDGVRHGEGDDYDGLDPGEALVVRSPRITGPAAGSHSIRAVADGNDEVDESNESNNGRTESITVLPPPAPDLIVEDVWTEPSPVFQGESFRIMARVKNQGNATAFAGLIANQEALFFLDGDQHGEGDDYDSLDPGETLVVRSPSIDGPSAGTHSVRVVADGNDEVDERNESNNGRTESITVVRRLSWRDGASAGASVVSTIQAGQTVYARVYGDPGETFEVEVREDDTEGPLDLLGDDRIETLSITVGNQGFGTAAWTAAWQGDDADDPQNQYYLYYDVPFSLNNLESDQLHVSVGSGVGSIFANSVSFDWDTVGPLEGLIDVTLSRADSNSAIDPAAQTWLIIHGKNGSFTQSDDNRMWRLTQAVDAATGDDQVLTLDWRRGAASANVADFSGEQWILTVAQWAALALTEFGFPSSTLNVIGHSWGAVTSGEFAAAFPGGVGGLVALDPAEDAIPPFGTFYSTENVVFGGDNSEYAWAFYSRDGLLGIPGSERTPTTADEAFVITGSSHNEVVDLFATMIADPVGEVSRFFTLDRLLARADGPWERDQYTSDGLHIPLVGGYEGVISTTDGGTKPVDIVYVDNGSFAPGPGDYNGNGQVEQGDLDLVLLQWGNVLTDAGSIGWFNNLPSGAVDQQELDAVLLHWGEVAGQAAPANQAPLVAASGGSVTSPTNRDLAYVDWASDGDADAAETSLRERFDRLTDDLAHGLTMRFAT